MLPKVDDPSTLVVACAGVLALVHFAFRSLRRRQRLVGIPTSAAGSVHIGLNRVRGVARPIGGALVSPVTGSECAAWTYDVEEEWRHDSVVRWRRRRRWRSIVSERDQVDLDLVDESGSIVVRVEGASVVGQRTHRSSVLASDPAYFEVARVRPVAGATGRRRVTETVIALEHPTTVVGTARLQAAVPLPEIGWDDQDRMLLVSSVDVGEHARRHLLVACGMLLGAAAVLALAPVAIRQDETEYVDAVRESGWWVPILLCAAVLLVATYWLAHVQHSLVDMRQRVARAWSLVAVEVARRHALLPELAEVASASARHERVVLAAVAAARSLTHQPPSTGDVATMAQTHRIDTAEVDRLVALAEQNPELHAGEAFLVVQAAVIDAENRLALARAFYNDSVTLYTDRRTMIPASLVAGVLGFGPADLYPA